MGNSLSTDPLLRTVPERNGRKVLDPVELTGRLGKGGMGSVYKGRHLSLDIDVAVKLLDPGLAQQHPALVERFQREARLTAKIRHPNLIQVFDVREADGLHYLVMEFVPGQTLLHQVKERGALPVPDALDFMIGAARGIAAAHKRGVVHRDIKPENMLLDEDGTVKVADLGLAKALDVDQDLTRTDSNMGTPRYMSPEQWDDAKNTGPPGDVWALGATLYFLLTGRHAIEGSTLPEIYKRVCVEQFPDVRTLRPNVPPALAELLTKATAPKARDRFSDAGGLCAELERIRASIAVVDATFPETSFLPPGSGGSEPSRPTSPPLPRPRSRRRAAFVLLLLLVAVGAGAFFLWPEPVREQGSRQPEPDPKPVEPEPPPRKDPEPESPPPVNRERVAAEAAAQKAKSQLAELDGIPNAPAPERLSSRVARIHEELVARARQTADGHVERGRQHLDAERYAEATGEHEAVGGVLDAVKKRCARAPAQAAAEAAREAAVAAKTIDSPGAEAALAAGDGEYEAGRYDEALPHFETARRKFAEAPALVARQAADLSRGGYVSYREREQYAGNEAGKRAAAEFAKGERHLEADEYAAAARAFEQARVEYDAAYKQALTDQMVPATIAKANAGSAREKWQEAARLLGLAPLKEADAAFESAEGFQKALRYREARVGYESAAQAYAEALRTQAFAIPKGYRLHSGKWAEEIRHQATGIVFRLLPAGRFQRGSLDFEADERPVREVTITRPFYLATTETTVGQWSAGSRLTEPKVEVSWNQARNWCRERGWRLPTEAEWEYACRAGGPARVANLEAVAVFGQGTASPVRARKANAWGLHDMLGNVWEWCEDAYDPASYEIGNVRDPLWEKGEKGRVLRGGAWNSRADECRPTNRHAAPPGNRTDRAIGFRAVYVPR